MPPAILLAAGSSSRMGRPKQLLPHPLHPTTTLLRHAAQTALASTCHPLIVVLGAHAAPVAAELTGLPAQLILNPAHPEGIASSIRAGIRAALSLTPAPEAALLLLCDQPYITPALLNALAAAHRAGHPIAAAAYANTLGVPALFDRRFFPDLLSLRGDTGAKPLLRRHAALVHPIAFPAAAPDLDTPADLRRI